MSLLARTLIFATIFFILLGAWAYHSKSMRAAQQAAIIAHSGIIEIENGPLHLTFQKTTPIDETYMLFGFRATLDTNNFADGYIAGIPLETANILLSENPDMGRCGSQGSTKAQQAIQNIHVIQYSESIKNAMHDIETRDREALNNRGPRLCVRLQGHRLNLQKATSNNQPTELIGFEHFVELSHINITPCL